MIHGFNIVLPIKLDVPEEVAVLALKDISDAIDLEIFENIKIQIVTDGGKVAGLNDHPNLTVINGGKTNGQ